MGVAFAQVKGVVEQYRGSTREAVRKRLGIRLGGARLKLTELAELTGDDYKNVQRWMGGTTKTIPADFVGRYIKAVPVSPLWILTGEGSAEPVVAGTPERLYDLVEAMVEVKKAGIVPDDLHPLLEQVTMILRRALHELDEGDDELS